MTSYYIWDIHFYLNRISRTQSIKNNVSWSMHTFLFPQPQCGTLSQSLNHFCLLPGGTGCQYFSLPQNDFIKTTYRILSASRSCLPENCLWSSLRSGSFGRNVWLLAYRPSNLTPKGINAGSKIDYCGSDILQYASEEKRKGGHPARWN